MATTWEEFTQPSRSSNVAGGGTHAAFFFKDSSEKQSVLFQLCTTALSEPCFILYIAGKQGTKGIRLSMKDAGIDVAGFERQKKLRIADSEEFYLNLARTASFRTMEALSDAIQKIKKESQDAGNELLMVISETDQIVRKGFLRDYMEFEKSATMLVDNASVTFICAYDERELAAARVSKDEITKLHGQTIT
ncbi:MAG: MEDS domain-containing protein [Nitrososphaerales archaeon]